MLAARVELKFVSTNKCFRNLVPRSSLLHPSALHGLGVEPNFFSAGKG